jgi:hypothetical protein
MGKVMAGVTSVGRYQFLLAYTTFLFFIIQISSMAGQTIVQNAPTPPVLPASAPSAIDIIGFVLGNVGYFFLLMLVSTNYLLFGIIILLPFVITLLVIVIEILEALIP